MDPYEGSELEKATKDYVDRLKDAYPDINERDLYDLVLTVARRRVEEAEGVPPAEAEEKPSRAVHPTEPAEGRDDVGAPGAERAGE